MHRREKVMNGWVNFPMESDQYKHTGEGGMVVKLVAIDAIQFDEQFGFCCGAYVQDTLCETLVSDETENHYPQLTDSYDSIPYLAAIVMGSTGWSGFDWEAGNYWNCTFDDLTDEGKALYNQIQALYPDHQLQLLTFLDT